MSVIHLHTNTSTMHLNSDRAPQLREKQTEYERRMGDYGKKLGHSSMPDALITERLLDARAKYATVTRLLRDGECNEAEVFSELTASGIPPEIAQTAIAVVRDYNHNGGANTAYGTGLRDWRHLHDPPRPL